MMSLWYLVYVTPPNPKVEAARPLYLSDAVARCEELKAAGFDFYVTEAVPPNRRITEEELRRRTAAELE